MIDRPDDLTLPPPEAPDSLKPYHCGWYGHVNRNCNPNRGGCGRRFSKKEGTWDLIHCPDCGTHRYCMRRKAKTMTTCTSHGAGTLANPAGRPITNGRFARALEGTDYLQAFEDSLNDPQQLRLNQLIAIADSRVNELLTRQDSRDSKAIWEELQKALKPLKDYQKESQRLISGFIRNTNSGNKDGAVKYLNDLTEHLQTNTSLDTITSLVREGLGDWALWQEVQKAGEHRRKLADTERRLHVDTHKMVALDKMMVIMQAFLSDIMELVPDSRVQNLLGERLERRLNGISNLPSKHNKIPHAQIDIIEGEASGVE